jgi:hypothetical protein
MPTRPIYVRRIHPYGQSLPYAGKPKGDTLTVFNIFATSPYRIYHLSDHTFEMECNLMEVRKPQ